MKKLILFLLISTSIFGQDTIVGNKFINSGQSTTLSYITPTIYLWNTGETTATINVSPVNTTTYTLTVTRGVSVVNYLATVNVAGTYDVDAEAFFNRVNTMGYPAPDSVKTFINNLVVRLKTEMGVDGVTSQWNSLDVINLMACYNKAVAGLNIKSATIGNATIMTDYANSFVVNKGFKGNGTSFKMNSNFNPFDGGTYKFKNNDNSFGCYINTNTREVKGVISNVDASQNGYELRTHTSATVSYNGNTVGMTSLAFDATGSNASKRTPDNKTNAYKNWKSSLVDNNSAVTSTVNKSFKYFCRDVGGTYSLYSLNRVAYIYFGSSNVNLQKLDRAIIETYLKPVGGALLKRVVFDGNSFFSQAIMPATVMDLLWSNGIECTSHVNAIYGTSISTMITNAPTKVDPYQEAYFTKEVFLFWELTNTMKGTSANVDTAFNRMKRYFDQRHIAGWTCPIVSGVCPPFASNLTTGISPIKRDSTTNLTLASTINGKIRANKVLLGIQAVSDEGAMYNGVFTYDPVFKDALGVAGVGELNTTYFVPDGHMTTFGYYYWATNHLYPQCLLYLQ